MSLFFSWYFSASSLALSWLMIYYSLAIISSAYSFALSELSWIYSHCFWISLFFSISSFRAFSDLTVLPVESLIILLLLLNSFTNSLIDPIICRFCKYNDWLLRMVSLPSSIVTLLPSSYGCFLLNPMLSSSSFSLSSMASISLILPWSSESNLSLNAFNSS